MGHGRCTGVSAIISHEVQTLLATARVNEYDNFGIDLYSDAGRFPGIGWAISSPRIYLGCLPKPKAQANGSDKLAETISIRVKRL